MTKHETREIKTINAYMQAGMIDTAARSLSALIRASRTRKSRDELFALALDLDLVNRPDFII